MLSNRQNAVCKNTVLKNAPLASVDICDIDTSDNDDNDNDSNDRGTDRNELAAAAKAAVVMAVMVNEQCSNKRNSEQNISNRFTSNKPLNGTRQRPRPSSINLKSSASDNIVKANDEDLTDGCFSGTTEESEHSSNDQGINIQFQDIIYRARREISWDRCEYHVKRN